MDFFLDIPSTHCAKQLDAEALGKVSAEMPVQLELRDRRLHVRAQDATTALSAACQLIVNMKRLGTCIKKSDLGRVCDWGAMLTNIVVVVAEPRLEGQMGARAVQYSARRGALKFTQRRTRERKRTNFADCVCLLRVAIFRSTGHASEANTTSLPQRRDFSPEPLNHARMNLTSKYGEYPARTGQMQIICHFKRGTNY